MQTRNPELQLAHDYVKETGCNIYLTGKAGTGKTTFLHSLKMDSPKRMIVTAPTGVAAINAGGVTLHSFFQLPFGPFIPGRETSRSQFRYSRDKISIIKSLDLLVIDEISMVRADLLDAVDSVLRRFRSNTQPFGGVQLLMIGDLFQLPPVVKHEETQLLAAHYHSPYFFSSNCLAQTELVTIELKNIYRQSDPHFINLLNKVRDNKLDHKALDALNSRVIPDFSPNEKDGYITLCTHNNNADLINHRKLEELEEDQFEFEAEIEGEFSDNSFPAAYNLQLKKGAQVMFIRNDLSADKRFFNGKIGTITHISDEIIRVKCPEDAEAIEVEPSAWENVEYSLNEDTQEIDSKIIGIFRQYPLRLAWAITIHKSQGLTFNKAIIDAQAAFAHGQVYVALSRCRTLEGMILSSLIRSQGIRNDPHVINFTKRAHDKAPDASHLIAAKIRYQQHLLIQCFDFQRLQTLLRRFTALTQNTTIVIQASEAINIEEHQQKVEEEIYGVCGNFQRQLQNIFDNATPPTEDPIILERIAKASDYFKNKITEWLKPFLNNFRVDSDNKELRKKIRNSLKYLQEEITIKYSAVTSCEKGFSPSAYFRAISSAAIEAQKTKREKKVTTKTITYSESDITHPELFNILKEWRNNKAKAENIAHFQVLHQKTLVQIAVNLPETIDALLKIKGIGEKLAEKYGNELIKIVSDYRLNHNIEAVELPITQAAAETTKPQAETQGDTRQQTLALYAEGLTASQIAEKRSLTQQTIEKHLAKLIESGDISISDFIPAQHLDMLIAGVEDLTDKSLKEIKQTLADDVSYAEINYVLAHLRFLDSKMK